MRVNRLAVPMLWMMLSVLLSACSSTMTQPGASLYDRLGGRTAIAAVVDDFVGNVAADKRINGYFANANIPRLKQLLEEVLPKETAIKNFEVHHTDESGRSKAIRLNAREIHQRDGERLILLAIEV